MATPISDLYPYVRALLGDFDPTVRKYEDSALLDVIKTVVVMGKVPGYALDAPKTGIEPALATPRDYTLLLVNAALVFVSPQSAAFSYRTRALSESFGHQRDFLFELHTMLQAADLPAMMGGWSDFASWMTAQTGLNLWMHLTEMTTDAPVANANISASGLNVSG